jgi:perosamine synthetase
MSVPAPLSMAHIVLTEEDVGAAVAVLRSGALREGPECAAFEREFAAATGAAHAVSCANGSAALHLVYHALLRPGDEILVPSFTFVATASMAALVGARVVPCDVDPVSFHLDLDDARRRLTSRTRAIAPVHLYGNPCLHEDYAAFAREHGLALVYDAAQAHGARCRGRDVGSLGDAVCYSFYPSKNLFVGEGGMITTGDEELARRLRLLRSHGQSGKYLHTLFGYNYRMTDVEAAIGRSQLRRLDAMLERRARNARLLNEGLEGLPGLRLPAVTPGGTHAWHQYTIVVDPAVAGLDRDELARRLAARGVPSAVHYPRGVHQQPVFADLVSGPPWPTTEALAARVLSLPVHHGLTDADVGRIVRAVHEACR